MFIYLIGSGLRGFSCGVRPVTQIQSLTKGKTKSSQLLEAIDKSGGRWSSMRPPETTNMVHHWRAHKSLFLTPINFF